MRLKTTSKQRQRLESLMVELCDLYNAALQERRDAWKVQRKKISLFDQQRELTQLRASCPVSVSFPAVIQRDPLRRVDRAFKAFFRRVKAGEHPGYPRFKSVHRYDSFSVEGGRFKISDGSLSIVRIGSFRTKTRCKLRGEPRELRIKRCGQKWRAQVVCEIGPAPEKVPVASAVGIDVGLSSLATLSDGTEIRNPRWGRAAGDELAKANQSLARKMRGSRNRSKARERLRRTYQRIVGRRSTYLTAVAKSLVRDYDLIAYEDLKIRQMVRSNLAKSILDAAWKQLIGRLHCEAEYAGKWMIPVDPRGTTQQCYGCKRRVPKTIAHRIHECPHCGLCIGRDHNAALNVLERGVRSVALAARGCDSSGTYNFDIRVI
jgi:putative transposase